VSGGLRRRDEGRGRRRASKSLAPGLEAREGNQAF
jgi:hypothetical protein